MQITPTNPFKGRQYPGELILLCVRLRPKDLSQNQ
jgi:hypothetical protein